MCLHEHGERIPLTIEGSNPEKAAWTCFVSPRPLGATEEPQTLKNRSAPASPCRRFAAAEFALPLGVAGPRDLWSFSRFDAKLFSVTFRFGG